MLFSGRVSSLRTLVRYGLGMAGKGEETGTGGRWLASLFERLKTAVERATDMICSEEPETLDEAEKLARRAPSPAGEGDDLRRRRWRKSY